MNSPTPWNERPFELANLFNPAFIAILITMVAKGYKSESENDMPYSVAFLAIPLIIYPNLNEQLPKSARSKLHIWLTENQDILFEFPDLARALSPYIREGISFGVCNMILEFSNQSNLISKEINTKKLVKSSHISEVLKKAHLVGKLLGQTKKASSLFSFFGVRP